MSTSEARRSAACPAVAAVEGEEHVLAGHRMQPLDNRAPLHRRCGCDSRSRFRARRSARRRKASGKSRPSVLANDTKSVAASGRIAQRPRRFGRAIAVKRIDDPALAVGRDRQNLDPDPAHLHVGRRDQEQPFRRHVAARRRVFAPFHQPDMVGRVASHFKRQAEPKIAERLQPGGVVAGGKRGLGDFVPRHKRARQRVEVITWKCARPGRGGDPSAAPDHVDFLMVFDDRAATRRDIIGLVRESGSKQKFGPNSKTNASPHAGQHTCHRRWSPSSWRRSIFEPPLIVGVETSAFFQSPDARKEICRPSDISSGSPWPSRSSGYWSISSRSMT